jgi:hypothetical protein
MTRQELRDYWEQQLSAQEASGLSGRAWCAREGVCYGSFLRWRQRLAEPPTALTWIPVAAGESQTLVVSVGTARIEVPGDFDPALLRRVVAALAG